MEKPVRHVIRTRTDQPGIRMQSRGGGTAAPIQAIPKKKSGGPPIALILVLLILGAGGYYGWKTLEARKAAAIAEEKAFAAKKAEIARLQAEEDAKYKAREAERKAKAEAEKAKREKEIKEARERAKRLALLMEGEETHHDPKRTDRDMWLEDFAGRQKAKEAFDAAKKNPEGTTIDTFAGIVFGEPLKDGAEVYRGPILDEGETPAARGVAIAVFGPKLAKPPAGFDAKPLVWLSPKTRRPWRVDLKKKVVMTEKYPHDAMTTNLVQQLRTKYPGKAFTFEPYRRGRPGCEFVILSGKSTIRIEETRDLLTLRVERDDLKLEAKAESDELRAAELAADEAEDPTAILDSVKYPQGPAVKYTGTKMRTFETGTLKAFCGLRFGYLAKPLTPIVTPHEGAKGFFLDYRRAKCKAFHGFTKGRADIDPYRGGVYAVRLFSAGDEDGLSDEEYHKAVRGLLTKRYGKPTEEKAGAGGSSLAELIWKHGDTLLSFGPREEGGFHLDAENQFLAEVAKQAPAVPKKSRYQKGKRK